MGRLSFTKSAEVVKARITNVINIPEAETNCENHPSLQVRVTVRRPIWCKVKRLDEVLEDEQLNLLTKRASLPSPLDETFIFKTIWS